jgi:hypothetical protein
LVLEIDFLPFFNQQHRFNCALIRGGPPGKKGGCVTKNKKNGALELI